MATFVPEWNRASGRELRVKRTLSALDDDHVVRRPVRPGACSADLFVEHRVKGWLAVAVSPIPFSDLDPGRLLMPGATDQRREFEQRLAQLERLASRPGPPAPRMPVLLVMWC